MWPVNNIISEMSWLDENTRNRIREETTDKIISELSIRLNQFRLKNLPL